MDEATRVILANVAASFLGALVFVILALWCVALFMLWRALGRVGAHLPEYGELAAGHAERAEVLAREVVASVLDPGIGLTSYWIGLKAAARSFLRGDDTTSAA